MLRAPTDSESNVKPATTNHNRIQRHGRRLLCAMLVYGTISLCETTSRSLAGEESTTPHRAVPTRLPAVAAPRSRRPQQPGQTPQSAPLHGTTASFAAGPAAEPPIVDQPPIHDSVNWLRSGTAAATVEVARRTLSQAHSEFRVGAWLSAETSAWEAIRWAAEAIDQAGRESAQPNQHQESASALVNLQVAKQAIMEARDFSGVFDLQDPTAISRIARSHQTDLLDDQPTTGLSGTNASDQYLDFARVQLASIASRSREAAEALDLLAAVYLRRADAKTIPSATALCLRRAALQGQPDNASLAANLGAHLVQVGLLREARWALEHSMSIQPNPQTADALASLLRKTGNHVEADAMVAAVRPPGSVAADGQRIRIPEITQLTPEEFAYLSKPVVWPEDVKPVASPRTNQLQAGQPQPNQLQADQATGDLPAVDQSQRNASLASADQRGIERDRPSRCIRTARDGDG